MMRWDAFKWVSYTTAAVAIVLATAWRMAMDPILGDSSQFVVYYAAVMLTATVGGTVPGLLTAAAGAVLGQWLFVPPQQQMLPTAAEDIVRLLLFLGISAFISIMAGRLRAAKELARQEADIAHRAEMDALAARRSAEEARGVAEEANSAKDHFLATLSHELRNPLTPIIATVSLLKRDPAAGDGVREHLEVIGRNAELEARLIDDLLDITRIARGKVELDKHVVDLGNVIHHAVEVCKPDIEARRLHFGVELAADAPYWIEADAARLQQVFWNLLKNAIKFTPHGGCVGIRCRADDSGHVVAEVNDSGRGIEPAVLPRIFNAFEQTERTITRQFGGLGLGLAISKSLVEMHGGTIEALSDGRGKGATFRVRLPVAALSSKTVPGRAPSLESAAARHTRRRILLVEDHGDTARIMRQLLTLEGHEVQTAGDVATALELVCQESFDLLISDLGLPDRSGLELMRELRLRGQTVPAIAMSGYGQEQDVRRSREVGFAVHLTKPVNLDSLARAMDAATSATEACESAPHS